MSQLSSGSVRFVSLENQVYSPLVPVPFEDLIQRCSELSAADRMRPMAADFSSLPALIFEAFGLSTQDFSALLGELPLAPHIRRSVLSGYRQPSIEKTAGQVACLALAAPLAESSESFHYEEYFFLASPTFLVLVTTSSNPLLPKVVEGMEQFPDPQPTLSHFFAALSALGSLYNEMMQVLAREVSALDLEVFDGDPESPTHIYRLSKVILQFQQHVAPISESLDDLTEDFEGDSRVTDPILLALRHCTHRIDRAQERSTVLRELLSEVLQVYSALISLKQNNDTKMISAWAAILVVPTLIAGIYGMNFEHMPELSLLLGYPMALGIMVLAGSLLYLVFKRKGWL